MNRRSFATIIFSALGISRLSENQPKKAESEYKKGVCPVCFTPAKLPVKIKTVVGKKPIYTTENTSLIYLGKDEIAYDRTFLIAYFDEKGNVISFLDNCRKCGNVYKVTME